MSRYKAYAEYKESGEEWLGAVPAHWEVIQIKHLSPIKRGASPRPIDDPKYFDDDGEYAWTRIADVTASDVYLLQAPQRLSSLGSSLSVKLEPESLFLSIAGTVGKPCLTGIKACIHDGFVYFPGLNIPNKFLFYIFAGEQAYKGLGKFGTQLNLNTDTVGGIKIGCADNNELEKIIKFLDHETAKIDTLIAKQQGLIKLLKEKRQAVISHAVTKGLNPKAPMRDSGVEWLGEVPAHWEISRVKHIASRISSGKTPSGGSEVYVDDGITFLRSQNVYDEGLRLDDVAFIAEAVDEAMAGSRVLSNDVLLNITGASIGRSCVVPINFPAANVNQHVCVIRLPDQLKVPFVGWTFKSTGIKNQIDHAQNGAAREGLNFVQIGEMVLALPPANEQIAICSRLDTESAKLDALNTEAQRAVDLLQERRTALISAAVTGKIDVRDEKYSTKELI